LKLDLSGTVNILNVEYQLNLVKLAALIDNRLDTRSFNVGRMFNHEVYSNSPLGQRLQTQIEDQRDITNDTVMDLVKMKWPQHEHDINLLGFPKDIESYFLLKNFIEPKGYALGTIWYVQHANIQKAAQWMYDKLSPEEIKKYETSPERIEDVLKQNVDSKRSAMKLLAKHIPVRFVEVDLSTEYKAYERTVNRILVSA